MEPWIVDMGIWIACAIFLTFHDNLERDDMSQASRRHLSSLTSTAIILLLVTTIIFPFISPEHMRKMYISIVVVLLALTVILIILGIIKYLINNHSKKRLVPLIWY